MATSGDIEIFDDVELSSQSKHPRAVRKQAMLFDHLIIGVDRFFICLVPRARRLLALRHAWERQMPPHRSGQEFRKIEARFACGRKRLSIQFYGDPLVHELNSEALAA
jgi:hypothetical protein